MVNVSPVSFLQPAAAGVPGHGKVVGKDETSSW